MIKDNHVAAAGSVVAALRAVRAAAPDLPCEVEVDSLEQLDEVLAEGAELVLLDNFPIWQTQIAVQRRDAQSPATKLRVVGRAFAGHRRRIRRDGCGLPRRRCAHPFGPGARHRSGRLTPFELPRRVPEVQLRRRQSFPILGSLSAAI